MVSDGTLVWYIDELSHFRVPFWPQCNNISASYTTVVPHEFCPWLLTTDVNTRTQMNIVTTQLFTYTLHTIYSFTRCNIYAIIIYTSLVPRRYTLFTYLYTAQYRSWLYLSSSSPILSMLVIGC